MSASHPEEPHWYLNFFGVDTHRQGQGLGSAILKTSLMSVDEQGAIAYLESSNPANVPLYGRFGFEVTGELQVKDSPVVYPMVRPAQK
jgi:predicted N-acetyltransferase YhbS